MGYRKCSKHGWLETGEYTVDYHGETICPECGHALHDWSMEQPRSYEPKDVDQVYGAGNPRDVREKYDDMEVPDDA